MFNAQHDQIRMVLYKEVRSTAVCMDNAMSHLSMRSCIYICI